MGRLLGNMKDEKGRVQIPDFYKESVLKTHWTTLKVCPKVLNRSPLNWGQKW